MSARAPLALGDIRMRDPFVLEAEPGAFVLFGTTDVNVWGGEATGFDCYTSDDLVHWNGPVAAFRPPEEFWSRSQFWAPEVYARAGRWFMIATFLSAITGTRGIAVLAADAPTGPYAEWSAGPVTPADEPSLDGTLFVDDGGTPWLVYSRGAEGADAVGEMRALRLSGDLRSAVGAPQALFQATDAAWPRPLELPAEARAALGLAESPVLSDGPFLRRAVDGSLLMLWSSHSEAGYAMGLARSASGDVLGPWNHDPEPLEAHNGGHGMLLIASSGDDLVVFHHPNDSPRERPRIVPAARLGLTA